MNKKSAIININQKKLFFLAKLILLIIILFNIGTTVWSQKNKYFVFDYASRYENLKKVYEGSQYVSKKPIGWIPDEIVNAYAGGACIKGLSPILVISDSPPLGKYLIGLSTIFFNNEYLIILIAAIIVLIFMFLLSRQVLESTVLSLFGIMLLTFEPIFKNQLIFIPLLDIMQLAFLLPCFYFFNKGLAKTVNRYFLFFIVSSFFLGLFISTKFFITGTTIIVACIGVLFYNKQGKKLFFYILSLITGFLVLLGSYFRIFQDGYTFRQFFGVQKWIFLYHKSQLILPFSIWPLILFNRWHVWFGDKPVIPEVQWRISWPIIFIITLITVILYFFKKIPKKIEFEVIAFWSILYILFFSFGQITARYLVIYLPVLYIIGMFGIKNLWKNIR